MKLIDEEFLNEVQDQIKWAEKTQEFAEFLEELSEEEEKYLWEDIAASLSWIAEAYDALYQALENYGEYETKKEKERKYKWKNRETQAK